MDAPENLEIDGILYDSRLTKSIITLSKKYNLEQKEVAAVCVFFNSLMILEYHRMTDVFLKNCAEWKQSPLKILNNAVFCYTNKDVKNVTGN